MRVRAKVQLHPKERNYEFTDEWNMQIDVFHFEVNAEGELYVTFEFETELELDDPTFGRILDSPHYDNVDLIKMEYKLDTLLDVIALETGGTGLRVMEDEYAFSWAHMSASRTKGSKKIHFPTSPKAAEERYINLRDDDENLRDAMRFYRLNTLDEDDGERAVQLWSVIEKLYGNQPKEKYLTKTQLLRLKAIMWLTGIPKQKHPKIFDALHNINPVNTLDLMSDRIKLKDQDGPISKKDLMDLLREWKKLRGYQGHGNYLLRSENLRWTVWDIEDTVELFLESKVKPQMYHVIAFRDEALSADWRKSPSLKRVGDWNLIPQRGSGFGGLLHIIKQTAKMGDVYIFDYDEIYKVENSAHSRVTLDDIVDIGLRGEIKKEQLLMRA